MSREDIGAVFFSIILWGVAALALASFLPRLTQEGPLCLLPLGWGGHCLGVF